MSSPVDPSAAPQATAPAPLYPRLLRLRHVQPSSWQRAAFGEGSLLLAAVLVMADVASAWALVVVPLAVALVVKFHDLLTGALHPPVSHPAASQPPGATSSAPLSHVRPRPTPGPRGGRPAPSPRARS